MNKITLTDGPHAGHSFDTDIEQLRTKPKRDQFLAVEDVTLPLGCAVYLLREDGTFSYSQLQSERYMRWHDQMVDDQRHAEVMGQLKAAAMTDHANDRDEQMKRFLACFGVTGTRADRFIYLCKNAPKPEPVEVPEHAKKSFEAWVRWVAFERPADA